MTSERSLAELRAREKNLVDKLAWVRAEIARREAKAAPPKVDTPTAKPTKTAAKRSGTQGNVSKA